jgi:hypothetical protein
MASLVLGTVGTMFAGPIGGMVGSAVGGYIDQNILMPALFPQDDIHGPRVGDLSIQMSEEGSPLNYCIGPENRISGTIIWMSDLIEVKSKVKSSGGKGGKGGGQQAYEYSYYIDIAIALNEGKICSGLDKIYANGKLIYDPNASTTYEDATNYTVTKETTVKWAYNIDSYPQWDWMVDKTYMIIESPNGGNDLSKFRSGISVTTSGFPNAGDNGTFMCVNSWLVTSGADTGKSYLKLENPDTVGGVGGTVDLTQTIPAIGQGKITDLDFYTGTGTQNPDSLIESYELAGNVSGYRHVAYVVINRLALKDYGNSIPQLSFVLKADAAAVDVSDAIGEIIERTGLDSDDYDTTDVTGTIRGYAIRGPMATTNILQPVIIAHDLLCQERDGQLIFFDRDQAESVTILEDDLASHEYGENPKRKVFINDVDTFKLPAEVNVKYIDPDSGYQGGSQKDRKLHTITDHVKQVDIPLVMDPEDARNLAARLLWSTWSHIQHATLQLPPSYMKVLENDVITITADDQTYNVLVNKREFGNNGLIMIEGLVEKAGALAFNHDAEEAYEPSVNLYVPPMTILHIIDFAPLRDEDTQTAGFYHCTCGADVNADFESAVLYESSDDTNFEIMDTHSVEATIGVTNEALGGGVTGRFWDKVNTLEVELFDGELESSTEEDVLAGANRFIVGGEVIAAVNCTLVSGSTYTLSTLLRGIRDTEYHIDNHESGERVIYLNDPGIEFKSVNSSVVGTTKYYKSVPSGGDIDDFDSVSHIHYGGTIRPFSPDHVEGSRDGSGNLTIIWERQTRAIVRMLGSNGIPNLEGNTNYEVDVMNGSTVLRTISVTTESASYTYSQQETDWGVGTVPATVDIRVYQVSDVVGRGTVREATV